jgi:hypothetical protein
MDKRKSRLKSLLQYTGVLVVVMLCGVACGVKGPPQPPPVPAPAAPGKFQARLRSGCVELRWAAPEASLPDHPGAVLYEVLRADVSPGQTPVFKVLDRVKNTQYLGCALPSGQSALYKARAIDEDGRRGDETAPILVTNLPPPAPPQFLKAQSGDGFVDLSWTPGPDMPADAGYNVYRSEASTIYSWRPVNTELVRENSFTDGPLKNGTRYYYEVRAVFRTAEGQVIESAAPPPASAVPSDNAPPAPPQGFSAIWDQAAVDMRWLRNQEPDLQGYLVARRLRGGGEWRELFLTPISDTHYVDKTARRGTEYEYAVYAVDNAVPPNRSALSEVQVVYTGP